MLLLTICSGVGRNDVGEQDSILDSESTTTLINRGNDDARTIRSEWEADDSFLDNSAVRVRSSRQVNQAPGNRRRSVASMIRGLATTKGGRQAFARKLFEACENRNMTAIQALMKQGGSPNWTDDCRRLPLVAAVRTGQYTIVKALLDSGAKVNARQYWTETSDASPDSPKPFFVNALYAAIHSRNAILTRFLISQGAEVTCNFSVEASETVLFVAIASGDADIVSAVLEAGADSEVNMQRWYTGSTPLIAAIRTGNLAVVKVLLEYGSDPNLKTLWPGEAVPPLCLAIDPSKSGQQAASPDLVKALLDRGSDVRQTGTGIFWVRTPYRETDTMHVKGITATHIAASNGAHEALEMILSHGADPNTHLSAEAVITKSYHKEPEYQKLGTPLHQAADGKTVELLLRHGARLNERISSTRETPLEVAKTEERESAVEALVRAGANT
jgi:ankyrin repeat protein